MARKTIQIKTESYIRIDGELKRVKDLPPEVWEPHRRRLLCTYLNTLYRGEAEFFYPDDNDQKYKGGMIYDEATGESYPLGTKRSIGS